MGHGVSGRCRKEIDCEARDLPARACRSGGFRLVSMDAAKVESKIASSPQSLSAASGSTSGSALASDPVRAAALFEQSVAIMARLRAPDGCPWDREQTFDSIRKYTLEEAYEVFDAIERRDWPHLSEELGDLLLQVLFYAEMAANEGHFTMNDVLEKLNSKLVRRHPHVFGEEASRAAGNRADVDASVAGSSAAVLRNWEEIKAAEALHAADAPSAHKVATSSLDSVQRAMPALAEATKLGSKAAKSGFDWPSWRDLLPKLVEETAELEAEAASDDPARKPAVEAELGDLLFTVVNLGRHLGVDAEMALRGCNRRFRDRYRQMELASERPLVELAPEELEALWAGAKRKLAGSEPSGAEAPLPSESHGVGAEAPAYPNGSLLKADASQSGLSHSGSSESGDSEARFSKDFHLETNA